MKKISDELAKTWKELYEKGYGQYDMVAYESAHNRNTSWRTIQRELVRLGTRIRTMAENYALRKGRKPNNYGYLRKP
jgi:hypothetical protein